MGEGHPERPERLRAIEDELIASQLATSAICRSQSRRQMRASRSCAVRVSSFRVPKYLK